MDPISRSLTRRCDALRAIPDPESRAAAAASLLRALEQGEVTVREVRDEAAVALLADGRKKAEVARLIGTTRGFMAYYDGKVPAEPVSA